MIWKVVILILAICVIFFVFVSTVRQNEIVVLEEKLRIEKIRTNLCQLESEYWRTGGEKERLIKRMEILISKLPPGRKPARICRFINSLP